MIIKRKKWIAAFTALILFLNPISLRADNWSYTGGNCYQQCRMSPLIIPAIALGAIALAAIVVLALQQNHSGVK